MNWHRIKRIANVRTVSLNSFDEALKLGLVIYYDDKSELKILLSSNFETVSESIESGSSYYDVFQDNIYFRFGNVVKLFDRSSLNFRPCSETKEENIRVLNKDYCQAGTSKRRPPIKRSEIIRMNDNKIVFKWSDNKGVLLWQDEYPLFESNDGELFLFDLETKKNIWSISLDNGSFGKRLLGQTESVLFLQRAVSKPDHINVLAVNKTSGEILWETSNSFPYYSYDKQTDKLYGLSGKTFEIINAKSGERELVSELDVDVQISSHLTFLECSALYFSAFLEGNIPVFGAVDVNSGKLLFTQEVEIEGEKSFRKGLDQPIVVGNRLYVRDAMKTLHIFERA